MAFWDNLLNRFADRIAAGVIDKTPVQPILEARAYRLGLYKQQLRTKPNQHDDNVGLPFVGLVASRIVGQMIGRGVELDFEGDTETPNEQYIDAVMDANKEEILFHRAALSAVESGTGYLFVIPDGLTVDGVAYPRLQVINPAYVKMDSLPEDYEVVIRYTIEYSYIGEDGKEHGRRKVIEHNAPGTMETGNTWGVTDYEQRGNKWEPVSPPVLWDYEFPPIIHWQSLPSVADCYGEPDINPPMIELQDNINFTVSNSGKLIRLFAHPIRFGYGSAYDTIKELDGSLDKMIFFPDKESGIVQLEPLGDLAAANEHLKMLRQTFFDVARTVDIDSMGDKLGALTNFALRVLYQDNLTMIATKRALFGDMLSELIRRLQILNGMTPVPTKVVWPDFLPTDEVEEMTAIETKMRIGVLSKESASDELGIDWEKEKERIANDAADRDNIGAALLRNFTSGGGGFNMNNSTNNQANEEINNA